MEPRDEFFSMVRGKRRVTRFVEEFVHQDRDLRLVEPLGIKPPEIQPDLPARADHPVGHPVPSVGIETLWWQDVGIASPRSTQTPRPCNVVNIKRHPQRPRQRANVVRIFGNPCLVTDMLIERSGRQCDGIQIESESGSRPGIQRTFIDPSVSIGVIKAIVWRHLVQFALSIEVEARIISAVHADKENPSAVI